LQNHGVFAMGWASPPLHSATILWMYFVLPVFAELQRVQHQPKHDGTLNFLVVGDWGRKGKYNQSLVATQVHLLSHFNLIFYFMISFFVSRKLKIKYIFGFKLF